VDIENNKNPVIIMSIVVIVLCVFIVSVTRQLNFDESLALRTGWLYNNSIQTGLSFNMPIIWGIGYIAGNIDDPGVVIIALRIIVFFSLLAAFIYVRYRLKLPLIYTLFWITFCFANGAFLTHATEFRYDWAILIAWLIAFSFVSNRSKYSYVFLGLIFSWLLLHHLKGIFYAVWLYIFTLSAIYFDSNKQRKALIEFHSASIILILIWLFAMAALNRIDDLLNFYIQFKQLASDVAFEDRTSKIIQRLSKDYVWWMLALLSTCFAVYSLNLSRYLLWSMLFTLAPISFILIHPLPWAYLVAAVVPFLAFIMAWQIYNIYLRFPEQIGVKILCFCCVIIFATFASKEVALQYQVDNLSTAIQSLRLLKSHASIDDKIVDPSGTAYFLKPAHSDWYIDKLFRELAKQGRWQKDIDKSILDADWALNTYRLYWLSEDAIKAVEQQFPLVCGPLRLRKDSLKQQIINSKCTILKNEIYSVW
jgi:hypothetical protein